MCITRLGDSQPVDIRRTGMLSWYQPKECRIDIPFSESLEVSVFHDQGQCDMRTDTEETTEFFVFFLVPCFIGDFLDPFVITFDLCFLFLIRSQIFIQRFPIQWIKFQFLKPVKVFDRSFGLDILVPVPESEGIDLLL